MKQNKNYDFNIQKVYLEVMLSDAETFSRCQGIFNPELFDRKLKKSAEFIKEYVENYNVLPTYDMLSAEGDLDFKDPGKLHEEHYNWLLEEFEIFTRHKSLEKAILNSADLIEKGEYGSVETLIKNAVQIGLQKDIGINYWENPKQRLENIKSKNGQTSTGWKKLDDALFGGFSRGELNIFAAGSGGGKSLFLANLAANWAKMGLNVLYLTFELSEELVCLRLDSIITGGSSREIFKNIDDIEIKVKMSEKSHGRIQVKYMPSGKTVNDLRAYIKEYEIRTGEKLDAVLIDYLDLLMPAGKKIDPTNLFVKDKYVSEELRNLLMELKTLGASASQLNRAAVEEIEFDHSHISGGLSKVQTADNVIGIFSSRALREAGKYQIQLMKTRNSSGLNTKIDLGFNVENLKIEDIEEEVENEKENTSSLLTKIKRNNKNNDDNINSVKATTESTKLREFLKNM